jgi:hypothetical protein
MKKFSEIEVQIIVYEQAIYTYYKSSQKNGAQK